SFKPFITGLAVVASARRLGRRAFRWRRPPYEFEHRKLPFDILCGTDTVRRAIERGEPLATLERRWQPARARWLARRARWLAYRPPALGRAARAARPRRGAAPPPPPPAAPSPPPRPSRPRWPVAPTPPPPPAATGARPAPPRR